MSQTDPKKLFLGKYYDSEGKLTEDKMLYNPADLNTHCVITGMTGSGKTGLGIAMLEEIALKNIPAIIIDPKGDLTNLLLHFPELKGENFEPWLDPEAPARTGKDLKTIADETASSWKKGLDQWGFTSEDIAALKNISYTIFTPGSTIGNPINIMASFKAPKVFFDKGDENIRDEISTSVTALLGLIGLNNIDPLQSREHILLSTIIEYYWSMGKDVELVDMINAINEPPFDTLGALPLEKIYPAKERFTLAMSINNFLASPSFQTWNQGPTLDIGKLMNTPDNRPRFSIFYIQHLSDKERMFFVTMLYSQIETWMRTQPGTGSLRLAVYFDEVAGYLPPVQNPSSRMVILRMLKQARAFGVGLILATQNPIDIDYKALSNAGTWFIGRLQTEQDKERLLDGLTTTAGEINRSQAGKMISQLEKRAFLCMNIHDPGLKIFTSRWDLNYLAGPLTRAMIPTLFEKGLYEKIDTSFNSITVEAAKKAAAVAAEEGEKEMEAKDGARPAVAATINEYFVKTTKKPSDVGATNGDITYMAFFMAQAEAKVVQKDFNLKTSIQKAAKIDDDSIHGASIRWADYEVDPIDLNTLSNRPESDTAKYMTPPDWMLDAKLMKTRQSDFEDYIYRSGGSSSVQNMSDEYKDKIKESFQSKRDAIDKAYSGQLDKLEDKLKKAAADVDQKQNAVQNRNVEKYGAYGELALSLLTGRRKSISSSLSKTTISKTAQDALDKSETALEIIKKDVQDLMEKHESDIKDLENDMNEAIEKSSGAEVTIAKKDIFTDVFGIVWEPYYTSDVGKLVKAC